VKVDRLQLLSASVVVVVRRSKLINIGRKAVLRIRIKRNSIFIACSGTTTVCWAPARHPVPVQHMCPVGCRPSLTQAHRSDDAYASPVPAVGRDRQQGKRFSGRDAILYGYVTSPAVSKRQRQNERNANSQAPSWFVRFVCQRLTSLQRMYD